MEWVTILCPACWQKLDLEVASFGIRGGEFVTDCEICCRPMVVNVWEGPGGDLEVEVQPGNE